MIGGFDLSSYDHGSYFHGKLVEIAKLIRCRSKSEPCTDIIVLAKLTCVVVVLAEMNRVQGSFCLNWKIVSACAKS